jgi:endonuclease/exonuclease/phosphatase family metal-dependent hydrolase
MTFNIRYGTARDGKNAWPNRRALAVRVIRDSHPVIVGLQEALRFQLDEIRAKMPVYGEVGVGRDDGAQAGEYAAILYDRYRLQPLEKGHFWLSDTPEVPGSMTWGNRFPRIVTWARFRDQQTSETFAVYNTHWDHESQVARENGARLLLERMATRAATREPLLLLGDLNCSDDNPAFRLLAPSPELDDETIEQPEIAPPGRPTFADTYTTIFPRRVAASGTFHAFGGDRERPKIDFVLVRPLRNSRQSASDDKGWQVLQADIVHTNENGRYPSDHFPVTATLLITDVEVLLPRLMSATAAVRANATATK